MNSSKNTFTKSIQRIYGFYFLRISYKACLFSGIFLESVLKDIPKQKTTSIHDCIGNVEL